MASGCPTRERVRIFSIWRSFCFSVVISPGEAKKEAPGQLVLSRGGKKARKERRLTLSWNSSPSSYDLSDLVGSDDVGVGNLEEKYEGSSASRFTPGKSS